MATKKKKSEPGCLATLFGLTVLACVIYLIIDLIKIRITPQIKHNIKIISIILLIIICILLVFKIYRKIRRKYSIAHIDNMEGHQFEYACADILRSNGFKNVKVTQGSGDFGVDIIAEKGKDKYAIQCKRYSHKLNNKPIQEVIGGLSYYNCNKGAVMTNQYFTKPAKKLAKINGIELWDRQCLEKMLSKNIDTKEPINISKEVNKDVEQSTNNLHDELSDDLIWQAVNIIVETGNASTAILQRKLRIGFPRATRIMDMIEEMGIIGPQEGSKPRTIYVTSDDLNDIKKQYYSELIDTDTDLSDFYKNKEQKDSDEQIYVRYSKIITDLECNEEIYLTYVKTTAEESVNYFYLNNINIHLEKIDIKFETNEVIFCFSLKEEIKINHIKNPLKQFAEHIGVKYAEYIYPTSIPYTIGIKIPLPDYLKETSTLIYNCNKE